ncbi:MAG TPA: hypothetical protein PK344_17905 [Syntrophorhabdaceae bacterium]|nr:hypothetical protein [Syntrophorhabdaceae bacterium]
MPPSRPCSEDTAGLAEVQPFLEILEGLLHQVLVPVDGQCVERVLYLIA